MLPNGHIDLRRIVMAGVETLANRPRGGVADRTRLEAYDHGQRLAVWLTAARGLRAALDLLQVPPDPEVPVPAQLVASAAFSGSRAG